jgi:hypothetical protein
VRRIRIVCLSVSLAKRSFQDSHGASKLIISSYKARSWARREALGSAGQPAGAVVGIAFEERSVAPRFARSARRFRTGSGATITEPQLVVR